MSEEKETNPQLVFKDIPMGKSVKMTLDCAKAIATGDNQYGGWELWVGLVENQKVRNKDKSVVEDYSGKVIFFPTEFQVKTLEEFTGKTNEGVEITITKQLDEDRKYPIYYTFEKVSEGKPSANNLTSSEYKLYEDLRDLKKDGFKIEESHIIELSEEEQYKGKITKEKALEIFKMLQ